MNSLPFWLSRRLSGSNRTKRGTGRTGAVIAVLGVAFAVAVMEITLAVTSGFKHEITHKLEGFVAPVTISSSIAEGANYRDAFVKMSPDLINPICSIAPHAVIVPTLIQSGMLKTDNDFAAIMLKGYNDDYDAGFEKSNMVTGKWIEPDDKRSIVISSSVSNKLGLHVGDRVTACFFIDETVKSRPFEVKGIYESGLTEFDDLVAYTSGDAIRAINHVDSTMASAVELRGIPVGETAFVANRLIEVYMENATNNDDVDMIYSVSTIQEQGSLYLNWLDLLDTNVVVIFILMTLVAASTLISALFIQVLEKVNTIGLLRALGARNKLVSRIFVYLSLRLVGLGMILGNLIGLGFVLVQSRWHLVILDPEMYYLSYVPVDISPVTVIVLNAAVILAAWLILIVPARVATHLSPAQTLRFD